MSFPNAPKCNLDLYTWYLLAESKYAGCCRLSEILPHLSHDCINRFLLREQYKPFDLFSEIKHLINFVGGTISIDDTVIEKLYSKPDKVEFIGYFWSGNKKKTIKGINLITLYYTAIDGTSIPLNYRLYKKGAKVTKNDLFQQMLIEVISWGVQVENVTGDCWYSSKKNLKFLREQKLGIMMGIAKNRQVSLNKKEYQSVEKIEIDENGTIVYLKNFGLVKVFKKYLKNDGVRYYIIFLPEFSELEKIDKLEFRELHLIHWGIECYHRALKQLCGIKQFFVRKSKAVLNHFFCSIRGFIKLELMRVSKLIDNWYEPQRKLSLNVARDFIIQNIQPEFTNLNY